jgi:hypothetical protein
MRELRDKVEKHCGREFVQFDLVAASIAPQTKEAANRGGLPTLTLGRCRQFSPLAGNFHVGLPRFGIPHDLRLRLGFLGFKPVFF